MLHLHNNVTVGFCISSFFTARHPKDDGTLYFQSVHISGGGGVRGLRFFGGVPGLRFFLGGSQVRGLLGPQAVRVSGTAETECALGKPSV